MAGLRLASNDEVSHCNSLKRVMATNFGLTNLPSSFYSLTCCIPIQNHTKKTGDQITIFYSQHHNPVSLRIPTKSTAEQRTHTSFYDIILNFFSSQEDPSPFF
ncbi:Uncharacterized protein TCM_007579 [Theobroma cacao]|uniref:Uncharacterized protein n=1 Tax=Theobroma cacao TaxID=3641 RepID=A0A061E9F1_THECC|nr:Uncharacterized protein TCM_007579 [Theobroma cacao]